MAKTPTKAAADKPAKAPKAAAAKSDAPKTSGIHAPVTPSPELAEVVGKDALPRSQVISKVWDHIKKNNLQNPENKREILADDKLKKVFGVDKCSMFEMNKHISKHVKA